MQGAGRTRSRLLLVLTLVAGLLVGGPLAARVSASAPMPDTAVTPAASATGAPAAPQSLGRAGAARSAEAVLPGPVGHSGSGGGPCAALATPARRPPGPGALLDRFPLSRDAEHGRRLAAQQDRGPPRPAGT